MALTDKQKELLTLADSTRSRAYAPYSGITVGAALLADSGRIYLGANIENSAFSPSICAERVAFAKAVSEGERGFTAIAVSGGKAGERSEGAFPPCGVCRQVMAEFVSGDFIIILDSEDGGIVLPFSEILPHGFGKDKLK